MSTLMDRIDRIFDVPVEFAAKTFKLPAEQAVQGNKNYDRFAGGIYWAEGGGLLFAGGLAAGAAGVEAGGATAILSIGLVYAGVLRATFNAGRIQGESS